jgi:hypothetical protein
MNGRSLKDFPIFALGSFRNFHAYHPAHATSIKGGNGFWKTFDEEHAAANCQCGSHRSEDALWPAKLGLSMVSVLSIATILTRFQKYACARGT